MGLFDGLTALFRPAPLIRAPEEQARVDRETAALSLYHFGICPYCQRVRAAMARLALGIELRDIRADPVAHRELIEGGGLDQVPCLRIGGEADDRWLYESAEIVRYLERRFG